MAVPQFAVADAPIAIGPGLSPLEGARIDVAIDDLLATFVLTQSFRNDSAEDIEAVFTFPIPMDAVFLSLAATLGERELEGRIIEKQAANVSYEQAILEGDSAVLVERTQDGMLTANIGNLKPGETIALRLSFAQWLLFNGNEVRFRMPTTIAPRYGHPTMEEREMPVTDLLVEYRFAARIRVRGLLADAELDSPTHLLTIARSDSGVDLTLQSAWMDRDFVLDARLGPVDRCSALATPDGDGMVVTLGCAIDLPRTDQSLDIQLVVDCSGSMGGTSIIQAQQALRDIVRGLQPDDRVNLIRFGSDHVSLFKGPMAMLRHQQSALAEAIVALDADMGGTELLRALEAAAKGFGHSREDDRSRVIFLITDGDIHDPELANLSAACARGGIRIYCVGVGGAVSEDVLRRISDATGGVVEIVCPDEDMSNRVVAHFRRVRSTRASITRVDWPVTPQWSHVPRTFHAGDTVRCFARFEAPVCGDLVLHWQSGEMRVHLRVLGDTDHPGTRMAAAHRLRDLTDTGDRTAHAVHYQLLTDVTSAILIAARSGEDKAGDMPQTMQVPQMMAAGWGGTGARVMYSLASSASHVVACQLRPKPAPAPTPRPDASAPDAPIDAEYDACFRRISEEPSREVWRHEDVLALFQWIESEFSRLLAAGGDLAAAVEASVLRWGRTEGRRQPILIYIYFTLGDEKGKQFLSAMLGLKALLDDDPPTPVLDRVVANLRRAGLAIEPRPAKHFSDVRIE